MTKQEFENEYNRLKRAFPNQFDLSERELLIGRTVGPLRANWWRKIVDRMILEANPKFSIGEAARAETNADYSVRRTEELCRHVDSSLEKISEDGLSKVLEKLGANSFSEAVLNKKKNAIQPLGVED